MLAIMVGGVTNMKKKFFAFLDELAHSKQFWKGLENDLPFYLEVYPYSLRPLSLLGLSWLLSSTVITQLLSRLTNW